jgi:beta-phosphoglucomutase
MRQRQEADTTRAPSRLGYKAAIFDLDGVIVDTARYHYHAWKALARRLGFDFSPKDNERLKGVSRMSSLAILLEIGGLDVPEAERHALAEEKNRMYVELLGGLTSACILPGSRELLADLRARGVKTALGSASKNTPFILERLDIAGLFDAVVDGRHTSRAKPDPECFLMCARDLGVDPWQCVVFEDAEAGLQAARTAGMLAVGVGRQEDLPSADLLAAGLSAFRVDSIPWARTDPANGGSA